MTTAHDWFRRQGLTRPRGTRFFAGVCAGVGRRLGIEPWPARLLFVLLAFLLHGSLVVSYVILWILMPADETAPAASWSPEPPVSPSA
jgi:phage shock protein C